MNILLRKMKTPAFIVGSTSYLVIYAIVAIKNGVMTGYWFSVVNGDLADELMGYVNSPGGILAAIPLLLIFGVHGIPHIPHLIIMLTLNGIVYGFVGLYIAFLGRQFVAPVK